MNPATILADAKLDRVRTQWTVSIGALKAQKTALYTTMAGVLKREYPVYRDLHVAMVVEDFIRHIAKITYTVELYELFTDFPSDLSKSDLSVRKKLHDKVYKMWRHILQLAYSCPSHVDICLAISKMWNQAAQEGRPKPDSARVKLALEESNQTWMMTKVNRSIFANKEY